MNRSDIYFIIMIIEAILGISTFIFMWFFKIRKLKQEKTHLNEIKKEHEESLSRQEKILKTKEKEITNQEDLLKMKNEEINLLRENLKINEQRFEKEKESIIRDNEVKLESIRLEKERIQLERDRYLNTLKEKAPKISIISELDEPGFIRTILGSKSGVKFTISNTGIETASDIEITTHWFNHEQELYEIVVNEIHPLRRNEQDILKVQIPDPFESIDDVDEILVLIKWEDSKGQTFTSSKEYRNNEIFARKWNIERIKNEFKTLSK